MLSNAYFLAKFRFDTAENKPAKKLQNFANFPNFANPNPLMSSAAATPERGPAERARASSGGGPWASRGARRDCVSCAKCCFSRWPANLAALNRVRVSKFGKISKIFANFWRARSRLYQNESLQEICV